MAGRACHVVGSTTQVGLTQALGRRRTFMAIFKSKRCEFIGVGPVVPVPDVEAAVVYYCEQLGFDRDFVMGDPPDHGSVTCGRVGVQSTLATASYRSRDYRSEEHTPELQSLMRISYTVFAL